MRNVKEWQKRLCIFKDNDDFDEDVKIALADDSAEVEFALSGFKVLSTETSWTERDVFTALSEYYDVNVTSVHMDDCDEIGVWICYKEK